MKKLWMVLLSAILVLSLSSTVSAQRRSSHRQISKKHTRSSHSFRHNNHTFRHSRHRGSLFHRHAYQRNPLYQHRHSYRQQRSPQQRCLQQRNPRSGHYGYRQPLHSELHYGHRNSLNHGLRSYSNNLFSRQRNVRYMSQHYNNIPFYRKYHNKNFKYCLRNLVCSTFVPYRPTIPPLLGHNNYNRHNCGFYIYYSCMNRDPCHYYRCRHKFRNWRNK